MPPRRAYDGLTQRRGSYRAFRRGIAAAIGAELPVRLNIVVTDVSADETTAMATLAEEWGVPHNIYTNMTPTIYGGGESLLAQAAEHLRTRKIVHRLQRRPHLLSRRSARQGVDLQGRTR